MVFNDVAKLISCTYTVNSIGDSIVTETAREVFVEVDSISAKRKTEAMTAGIKPEIKFRLFDEAEYSTEEIIEYRAKRYNIVSVSIKDDHKVELTARLF